MTATLTTEQLEVLANAMDILGSGVSFDMSDLENLSIILKLEVSSTDQKRLLQDADILDFLGIYPDDGDVVPETLQITGMAVKLPAFWDTASIVLRSGSFYRLTSEDEVGIATNERGSIEYSARALGLDGSQFKILSYHLGTEDIRVFVEG